MSIISNGSNGDFDGFEMLPSGAEINRAKILQLFVAPKGESDQKGKSIFSEESGSLSEQAREINEFISEAPDALLNYVKSYDALHGRSKYIDGFRSNCNQLNSEMISSVIDGLHVNKKLLTECRKVFPDLKDQPDEVVYYSVAKELGKQESKTPELLEKINAVLPKVILISSQLLAEQCGFAELKISVEENLAIQKMCVLIVDKPSDRILLTQAFEENDESAVRSLLGKIYGSMQAQFKELHKNGLTLEEVKSMRIELLQQVRSCLDILKRQNQPECISADEFESWKTIMQNFINSLTSLKHDKARLFALDYPRLLNGLEVAIECKNHANTRIFLSVVSKKLMHDFKKLEKSFLESLRSGPYFELREVAYSCLKMIDDANELDLQSEKLSIGHMAFFLDKLCRELKK
jgi:hypothetical protein